MVSVCEYLLKFGLGSKLCLATSPASIIKAPDTVPVVEAVGADPYVLKGIK